MLVSDAATTPGTVLQPPQKLIVEVLNLNCGLVMCFGKREPNDEDVVWVETEIDRLQRHQGSHEKAGSGEQNQRQRNLADDQKLAKSGMAKAAADAFAGILQGFGKLLAGGTGGGDQAREDRGQRRDAETEQQNAPVQSDNGFRGDRVVAGSS